MKVTFPADLETMPLGTMTVYIDEAVAGRKKEGVTPFHFSQSRNHYEIANRRN